MIHKIVLIKTDDPICPEVKARVNTDYKSVFVPYSQVKSMLFRTKPDPRKENKNLSKLDSLINFYSGGEPHPILGTLKLITDRALNPKQQDNRG